MAGGRSLLSVGSVDFPRPRFDSVANIAKVGLCLAEQILGQEHKIPTAEWDWKVDGVAVGNGSVLTSK